MPLTARSLLAAALALALFAPFVRADEIQDLEQAAQDAAAACTRVAAHAADDDRPRALNDLAVAVTRAGDAATLAADEVVVGLLKRKSKSVAKLADKLVDQVAAAETLARDESAGQAAVVAAFDKASRTGVKLAKKLKKSGVLGFSVTVTKARWSHKPGKKVTLKVKGGVLANGSPCSGIPVCVVRNTGPEDAVEEEHEALKNGKFKLRMGTEVGEAEVEITLCGISRTFVLRNVGVKGAIADDPWGDGGEPATDAISYVDMEPSFRVAEESHGEAPRVTGGQPDSYSITPALPQGLSLDRITGAIVGTPQITQRPTTFTVTAHNELGSAQATFELQSTPEVPSDIVELEPGFVAERWVENADVPVKMAYLPDGRLLYTELRGGNVQVVGTDGTVRATPFATFDVEQTGERGLVGIAVAPDYETSGHVFVFRHTPIEGENPSVGQVIRLTASGNAPDEIGTDPTVLLTGIPSAILQNGGDVQVGPVDGMLYISTGDTNDENVSQEDGSLSGRILRIARDGSIPADNPIEGDPEWVRGLRNSFDMTFHPTVNHLFATENGPMAVDELNFIQKGKNFEWGPLDSEFPDVFRGLRLIDWTPVIVPTGLVFHSGASFGPGYANNIFLGGYDEGDVRRLVMSGSAFTDLDDEIPFLLFDAGGGLANRPLDLLETADGDLLVSTFSAIWRISRW